MGVWHSNPMFVASFSKRGTSAILRICEEYVSSGLYDSCRPWSVFRRIGPSTSKKAIHVRFVMEIRRDSS